MKLGGQKGDQKTIKFRKNFGTKCFIHKAFNHIKKGNKKVGKSSERIRKEFRNKFEECAAETLEIKNHW